MPANARSSARSLKPALRGEVPKARTAAPLARRRTGEAGVPEASAEGGSRSERRKHRTRERLLDAALTVFLTRGYDGATTTEMARVADLGTGTFYCYFRDKRAAFEGIAHRVARSVMDRWMGVIDPTMPLADGVGLALEMTAAFWREHPDQARLLLEDGPSFGTAAHLRLVDDFAAALRTRFAIPGNTRVGTVAARALGALVVGLAIEMGRLVLGTAGDQDTPAIARMVALARQAAAGTA
jgi:AcrR family transcriptional regulator